MPPISTIGLGFTCVSSLMREPNPPARMTTFIVRTPSPRPDLRAGRQACPACTSGLTRIDRTAAHTSRGAVVSRTIGTGAQDGQSVED